MENNKKKYFSYSKPGKGKYRCLKCGFVIELDDNEELPLCPMCGFEEFELIE